MFWAQQTNFYPKPKGPSESFFSPPPTFLLLLFVFYVWRFFHSFHYLTHSHSSVKIQLRCHLHYRKPSFTSKMEKILGGRRLRLGMFFP